MIRLIMCITLFTASYAIGQAAGGDTIRTTFYGLEMNQFVTGSGYSSGTEVLFSVSERNRSLSIGFYYGIDVKRITGIIARHEVGILRNSSSRTLQPYLFYNGIARITKSEDINNDITAGTSTPGIYKTFEHHIGIGLKALITDNFYISGSTGYGIFFGSMKKPVVIEGTNDIIGGNGMSPIFKLGFGIIL